MKKIIIMVLCFIMYSMGNGFIDTEVTASNLIDEAKSLASSGKYLEASVNYKKAGNVYASQAKEYKSKGLNSWTVLHVSAKECYSNAIEVLDSTSNGISEYYKTNVEHRIKDLESI